MKKDDFYGLVILMRRLLAKGGCPWDRKQTHRSLLKYLKEEAEEVAIAVRRRDWANLEEELGDLLLQVVFHAELARRSGRFSMDGVIRSITEKLVRRHPHVFGRKKLLTPEDVTLQWEEIKKAEKQRKKQKQHCSLSDTLVKRKIRNL